MLVGWVGDGGLQCDQIMLFMKCIGQKKYC